MRRHDNARGRTVFAQLLDRLDIGEGIHARSAVLFREGDAEQAHFGHLPDVIHREFLGLVDLRREGLDLFHRKLMYHLMDVQMHFVLFEIHVPFLL